MNQEANCNSRRLNHRKYQKVATALLFHLLIASSAVAQAGKLPTGMQAKIESAVSTFMTESKAPGLSVAIVREGDFVWSAGFGMADLENSVPATAQTLYRLASISK